MDLLFISQFIHKGYFNVTSQMKKHFTNTI